MLNAFRAGVLLGLLVIRPAVAASPIIQDVPIPAGDYYVGDVFGKQDYRGHANATVSGYRIMKTEVTYALYRSVSDWSLQHG